MHVRSLWPTQWKKSYYALLFYFSLAPVCWQFLYGYIFEGSFPSLAKNYLGNNWEQHIWARGHFKIIKKWIKSLFLRHGRYLNGHNRVFCGSPIYLAYYQLDDIWISHVFIYLCSLGVKSDKILANTVLYHTGTWIHV